MHIINGMLLINLTEDYVIVIFYGQSRQKQICYCYSGIDLNMIGLSRKYDNEIHYQFGSKNNLNYVHKYSCDAD